MASRSGFGAAVCHAFARSSIAFRNSARADRNVMAVSRLLGTAAACVVQLSFGAGHRKTYWNVCIKAAIVICHEIFSILALAIFLFKFLLKMLQNRLFFLWRRDPVLELQFVTPLHVVLLRFATQPVQIAM